MRYLEKENFDELIKSGVHLVDFYAEWCGPCKMLASVLEEVDAEIDIIKVNVDVHSELASKYKVMSIPTLLFFKDGVLKETKVGYLEKHELTELIDMIKHD